MNNLHRVVIAATLFGMFGCSNTARTVKRAIAGPPPATSFVSMDFKDSLALQMNRYRLDPSWILVLQPNGQVENLSNLSESGYKIVFAAMRNPGRILIFTGRGGRAVNMGDQADIARLVAPSGGKVLKSGIPYIFGPDGRTPKITKPIGVYSPAPYGEPMGFSIEMSFPDMTSAEATTKYIDTSFYRAKVRKGGRKAILLVTATICRGGEHDDEALFREIAKMHGGKVDWYGGQ